MEDYGKFIDDVFDIYLGSTWKEYQKAMKGMEKPTSRVKTVGSRGLSGDLLELVTQKIIQTLGSDAKLTGSSGQKADLVVLE